MSSQLIVGGKPYACTCGCTSFAKGDIGVDGKVIYTCVQCAKAFKVKVPIKTSPPPVVKPIPPTPEHEKLGEALYNACPSIKPAWHQLGDVTKALWIERTKT